MSTVEDLEKMIKDLGDRIKTLENDIAVHVQQPLKEHTQAIAEHAKKIANLEHKQDAK